MNIQSVCSLLVLSSLLGGCSDYNLHGEKDTVKDTGTPEIVDPDEECPSADLSAETVAVDEACELEDRPPVPVIEWKDEGVGSSLATPVVGNLTDDNGDGLIDNVQYESPSAGF